MALGLFVRSSSVQEKSLLGRFSRTLLSFFVCFGRFPGEAYKKKQNSDD
jgi:hypothetical protein